MRKTDKIVLDFIIAHPMSYGRQIAKVTCKSPNAVVSSLKRLEKEEKIVKHTKVKFFKNIKIPPNAVGYVYKFSSDKKEEEAYFGYLKNRTTNLYWSLGKMMKLDYNQRKPHVIKLARVLARSIKQENSSVINEIKNSLQTNYVNESMIGFFIFKILEKIEQEHDIPYGPKFYYEMLPSKYSQISIPHIQPLIDFINYNFPGQEGLDEILETDFSYFNKETRSLLLGYLDKFLQSRGYRMPMRSSRE
jgi:hypothetical protein